MKIERGNVRIVPISEIEPGDVLSYDHEYYMKVFGVDKESYRKVINIETGVMHQFEAETGVKKVNAKLIVEE